MIRNWLLIIVCLLVCEFSYSQTDPGIRINLMNRFLQNWHYKPVPCDDSLSSRVFHDFINNLDPVGLIFLQSDLDSLEKFRYLLDNEVNASKMHYMHAVGNIYRARLIEADTLAGEILANPLSFTNGDSMYYRKGVEMVYAKNKTELASRWRRYLKMLILDEMMYFPDDSLALFTREEVLKREPSARRKIRQKQHNYIKRILAAPRGYDEWITAVYLNTFSMAFDPHSNYFSKEDMEAFKSELSRDNLTFGFSLGEQRNGDLVISRLIPGGPAWRSNLIHAGDKLVSARWGDNELIDLTLADLEEAESFFAEFVTGELSITLKDGNGQFKTVSLVKEKIHAEENVLKSFILNGKRKVGYLSLPDFYTAWNSNGEETGCANDVAREIIKLKSEGIEALIIDLRYNGGGSVNEALDLAGIFIDSGPVLVYKEKNGKPMTMKDANMGTIYDGPLAILVNSSSASASEIFAAAIQDYKRGLVLGNTTFGKSTGQVMLPLDPDFNPLAGTVFNEECKAGYLKVTVDAIYRITGASLQRKGVAPDVTIPEPYSNDFRESDYNTSLPNDSVIKKTYYLAFPNLPLNKLRELSQQRIANDSLFVLLNDIKSKLEKIETSSFPLTVEFYMERYILYKKLKEDLKAISIKYDQGFEIGNTAFDKDLNSVNDYKNEINTTDLSNLKEDVVLREAYYIITDFLTTINK